ncbi:MAG: tetratricopeptide repeat protein [Dysgonomonas mossii]|uniref:tetratricopeptide repeat protein n=1 Tax=Dysgonomonas mossii TaxID=163665 RepID=UPI001E05F613|nr:tetratricopeptide repeat protein [Dysgonomonas mossii]MBS5796126.1 tetratricopeptide repeat protein [Dysgonomonas mossii]MBS7110954.1 tetratricopeptide repeat protein [Dysgonomonas mossii]
MKKIIFITLFTLIAVSLSAQKEARKAVRSGNKAYKDQRYGAAEAEYHKALKDDAASKEASFNLANAYYKQQKWDDALKEYQHYLTLENQNPIKMSAAWSNMGNTFLKKKANEKGQGQQAPVPQGQQPAQPQQQQGDNLKMSMEAYKNALRLNPKDDNTRYNLAVVQKMIQDRQNEDQNKDQNKDQKQDQNKDQNQDQNQNKDQKQDQKDQKDQNQMSQDNMQQMLQAIEQDEKNTQERVNQAKAQERKQKNENNRKQNKDW